MRLQKSQKNQFGVFQSSIFLVQIFYWTQEKRIDKMTKRHFSVPHYINMRVLTKNHPGKMRPYTFKYTSELLYYCCPNSSLQKL